ncbi:MAG TPA: DUF3995 domain-containing protein [Sulfurovum sp.]|nr:DUF3995 domain-containing protein [Sulfurovum sp.]
MLLVIILSILGLVHVYWGLGGVQGLDVALPTNEKEELLLNPGKILTFLVAIVLLGFAYIAYMLQVSHEAWITYAGWCLMVLFLLRAIGDFKIVGIFKKLKSTKFAKYDTWLFTPLCLVISAYFLVILVG